MSIDLTRRVLSSQIDPEKMHDTEVVVAGWVEDVRVVGKILFAILRDREGRIQITVKKNESPKIYETLKSIHRESVIGVLGKVVKSDIARMGFEIVPKECVVYSYAHAPLPIGIIDKVHVELDTRLRHRVLDIRKDNVRAIFKIKATLVEGFRQSLRKRGFTEVHTSKIIAEGTEGGANLFEVKYFERVAYLAQSPQFYKQMMVGAGFERVYEVGMVYRAEPHNTTRHLNEYLSLDLEMGFINDEYDVMQLENEILIEMIDLINDENKRELRTLGVELPEVPERIPVIHFVEAMEILGYKEGEKLDLDPEDEKRLTEWSKEEHDSEFLFVDGYPLEKRPPYTMPDFERPGYSRGFDLLFRGMEVTTGGQRIHQYDLLVESYRRRGYDPRKFEFYFEVFKYGMPPHGGLAIGAERLLMKLLNLNNIREAMIFPRDRERLVP